MDEQYSSRAIVMESYEKRFDDPELHCMDVMWEAINRHLMPAQGTVYGPQDVVAVKRAVAWLQGRVDAL